MFSAVPFTVFVVLLTGIVLGYSFTIRNGPQPASYPVDGLMLGKYQLTSDPSDHAFREYLRTLNVSREFTEVLNNIRPNVEIFKNGTTYHYKVITPFLRKEFTFIPHKEEQNTFVDGRKYKSKFEFEGEDSVVHYMTFPGANSTNKYIFTKEGMTAYLQANGNGNVVERKYKRVEGFRK